MRILIIALLITIANSQVTLPPTHSTEFSSQVLATNSEVEVKLRTYQAFDVTASSVASDICHTKNGAAKYADSKCYAVMNKDTIHQSGYDFISKGNIKLPSQLKESKSTNSNRHLQVHVKVGEEVTGCTVSKAGVAGMSLDTDGSNAYRFDAASKTCIFIPLNNEWLGTMEVSVEFTKTKKLDSGVVDKLKVKINLEFAASESCEGGCFGNVDDAMGLIPTITIPPGLPCLYQDGTSNRKTTKCNDPNKAIVVGDTLLAHGVLLEFNVDINVKDTRYKVSKNDGYDLLPTTIHDASTEVVVTVQGIGYSLKGELITAPAGTPSGTGAVGSQVLHESKTGKLYLASNLVADTTGPNVYPQYTTNIKMHVAYPRLKHILNSYISSCSSTCTDGFSITLNEGFPITTSQIVKAVGFTNSLSNWKVWIPKRKVISAAGSVVDFSSTQINPNYGLPVLNSADSSTDADGIPLSHLFEVGGPDGYDEVDEYYSTYELFNRLTIGQKKVDGSANTFVSEKYLPDQSGAALTNKTGNKCSSHPSEFGKGQAYMLGDTGSSANLYAKYFKECRIFIAGGSELDQALIRWDNTKDISPAGRDAEEKVDSSAQKVKLTVFYDETYRIGSTELSLLRRTEIPAGHGTETGVEVDGAQVKFKLYGPANNKFDIWGTDSMRGYSKSATMCGTDTTNGCVEVHGCNDGSQTYAFSGGDAKCQEKIVTAEPTGTQATIRSTNKCTGFMDIQLRKQIGTSNNLLTVDSTNGLVLSSPLLRRTYDVRLPCSRLADNAHDSVDLSFMMSAAYDLAKNEYELSWHTDYDGKGYLGKCHDYTNYSSCVACAYTGCSDNNKKTVNSNACEYLDLDFSNGTLSNTFWMRIEDGSLGGYTCRDQQFSVSVNAEATQSIVLSTPQDAGITRNVEIYSVRYDDTECSTGFKLKIHFEVEDCVNSDCSATTNLAVDSQNSVEVTGKTMYYFTHSVSNNYVTLESECIAITDCSAQDAAFTDFTGQHKFEVRVSGDDDKANNLGNRISSYISLDIDYEECPVNDVDIDATGTDAFGVNLDLLIEDNTTCATGCGAGDCTTCSLVNADAVGQVRLTATHNGIDLEGWNTANTAGDFEIEKAEYVLKRYEKLLDGSAGSQININNNVATHMLCKYDGSHNAYDLQLVAGNSDTIIIGNLTNFKCKINFDAFVAAGLIGDVFEIETLVWFKAKNNNRRRLLRSSQELKLGTNMNVDEKIGMPGITSGNAEATDDISHAGVESTAAAASGDNQNNDNLWSALIAVGIVALVLVLIVISHCLGLIPLPMCNRAEKCDPPKSDAFRGVKYSNLRY